ncbi:MAG: TrgA family protein [Rhodobacteraceae bacterium]|nr:TrgA family protein [Paracoccaceae bacterium]
MPTAAKLAAAAAFAIVAAIAAHLFIPALPEGTPPGWLREVSAAIGLLCGWWIMGNRVGKGYGEAAGSGILTSALSLFWVMLVFSIVTMVKRSMRMLYDGPMDAVIGVFDLMLDYGALLAAPATPVALILGGILGGWFTEWAGRRWP